MRIMKIGGERQMIKDVKIKEIKVHEDIKDVNAKGKEFNKEKGNFSEILRFNEGLLNRIAQVSVSRIPPWNIKAFHSHEKQDDVFYVLRGDIRLVLYDIRKKSPTRNEIQEIFMGESYNPKIVFIPRQVLHGYQTKEKGADLLYLTNKVYNNSNPDEHRVPYDDETIGVNWQNG